jgi:hypothetical protein
MQQILLTTVSCRLSSLRQRQRAPDRETNIRRSASDILPRRTFYADEPLLDTYGSVLVLVLACFTRVLLLPVYKGGK